MTGPDWSESPAVPTDEQVADAIVADTHPDVAVLTPLDFVKVGVLEIDMHNERVWVSVDGVTMLRAYRIRNLVVHDHRVVPQGELPFTFNEEAADGTV